MKGRRDKPRGYGRPLHVAYQKNVGRIEYPDPTPEEQEQRARELNKRGGKRRPKGDS